MSELDNDSISETSKSLDRRSKRTRRTLQSAVITLLQTSKLNEITINQIADAADINRRTFSSHFNSVEDVLESKIIEELSALEQEMTDDLLKLPIQYEKILPILIKHVDLQGNNLELIVNGGAEHVMNIALEKMIKKIHKKALRANRVEEMDDVAMDYITGFAIGACIGLLNKWISRGRVESVSLVTAMSISLFKPFIDCGSDIATSLAININTHSD